MKHTKLLMGFCFNMLSVQTVKCLQRLKLIISYQSNIIEGIEFDHIYLL